MEKTFNDMTNKELSEYCSKNNIDVDSKNVSKPTKKEYISAINKFLEKSSSNDVYDETDKNIVEDTQIAKDDNDDDFVNDIVYSEKNKKKDTRAEKRMKQKRELEALKHVIINRNGDGQTILPNQTHFSTWGNRLLGHNTDKFVLGKPWHVREGALRNLREAKTSVSIKDENGNTIRFETKPAYIIQELDMLSDDDLKTIAKRQKLRESALVEHE